MGTKATDIEEQINKLEDRGMTILDKEKAKEVLLDIGYYRLGFYWFPFEKTYPRKENRDHKFKEGTNFDNIVKLYYFDFNLRNILLKYINRIEINLRTFIIYYMSNKYSKSPTWFVNPAVVMQEYISTFDKEVYNDNFKKNPVIKRHHTKYINDKYAPAWKTIEFMTLGSVISLFLSIKSKEDRIAVCEHFGIKKEEVFNSYINLIRKVRNICAHGNVLFDLSLPQSIRKGPAGKLGTKDFHNLNGALQVIAYMLGCVSKHREMDLRKDIDALFSKYKECTDVYETLKTQLATKTCLNNLVYQKELLLLQNQKCR